MRRNKTTGEKNYYSDKNSNCEGMATNRLDFSALSSRLAIKQSSYLHLTKAFVSVKLQGR